MASVDYNTRLDGMDALFLKAERPRRWMTVTSIWTFKNDLSIEAVYKVFETLCEEFPRFALIPQDKGWFRPYAWANPVDWTPQTNIIEHLLQEPTKKAFQKYCAEQVMYSS